MGVDVAERRVHQTDLGVGLEKRHLALDVPRQHQVIIVQNRAILPSAEVQAAAHIAMQPDVRGEPVDPHAAIIEGVDHRSGVRV